MFQNDTSNNISGPENTAPAGTIQMPPGDKAGLAKQINGYFPYPYLNALGAVLVFVMLGKVVDWIVTGLVSRLVMRTKTDLDDKVLAIPRRPIFLSVLVVGLSLATPCFSFRTA